nr:DUF255 domain-containing protein [Nocardia sp. BMG111209]
MAAAIDTRGSLAAAVERDVPILLSVGYASFHWRCHMSC